MINNDLDKLRLNTYHSLLDLATDEGINASGKDEVFGCIFGRDSAITILKILKVLKNEKSASLYDVLKLQNIARTGLLTLVSLQGKETNIESGEQPGKFIHEYRKDKYERLVNRPLPWYVYPDGKLRNYDSIDSTPLSLIAIYKYWQVTGDNEFLLSVLSAVEKGLNWIITYGDFDNDDLIEYELPKIRKHGGLYVQSWTDSVESISRKDGSFPKYPIAPVEVQGYSWLALKLWSDFYRDQNLNFARSDVFGKKLLKKADAMKKKFNQAFLLKDTGLFFPAQAVDGTKNQIKTITGNPLLLLWATYDKNKETILSDDLIEDLVTRSFLPDMFDKDAGIRTMSTLADTYNDNENSYHNGSFWPKLNGMSHEGLANWGFEKQANLLRDATLKPIFYFGTPVELYLKKGEEYINYKSSRTGQTGCLYQAWSAASVLDLLT